MSEPGIDALDASLPDMLPVFPGLSVTGRYVLGTEGGEHRGDGLKAVGLPGGRVLLAVVDALGEGTPASTASVRLLAVLRGALEGGGSLEAALAAVDRYAASAPVARGATLAAAVLDQSDDSLVVGAAGHPAPLVARADGACSPLPLPRSRPLGLGGRAACVSTVLGRGDLLVMHTNGLLTGPDGRVGDGGHRLGTAVATWWRESAAASAERRGTDLCEHVLTTMQQPVGFRDDAVLLVAERTRPSADLAVAREAGADGLAAALGDFERWLDLVGAGLLDHLALTQALGEVAGNVVEHAYGAASRGELRIDASVDAGGLLRATVRDSGHWRPEHGPRGGRGLLRAGGLVDRMRVVRGEHGTEVVLEQTIGRPVGLLRSGGPHRTPAVPMDVRTAPGTLVVSGEVADGDAEPFREAVHEATCAGTQDARVDLTAVTRMAGTAVRVLFDYLARAEASAVALTVVAPEDGAAHQVLEQAALPHVTA